MPWYWGQFPTCRGARVLWHSRRGRVSTPRLTPAPPPHRGETLPPGDQHISSSPFSLTAPPARPRSSPPAHPGPGCPVPPSPRAGTDRVCPNLKSILDFPARSRGRGSGRASPHRPHRRGFHNPTVRAQPCGGSELPAPLQAASPLPLPKRCQGRQGWSCPASLGTAKESPQFRARGFGRWLCIGFHYRRVEGTG